MGNIWTRYLLGYLILLATLSAACASLLPDWSRITLIGAAVPLFGFWIWKRHEILKKTRADERQESIYSEPSPGALQERIAEIFKRCNDDVFANAEQRTAYTYILLHPAESRKRIRENIDLSEDLVTRICQVEFSTHPADVTPQDPEPYADQQYFVPIVNPFKGRLISGLDVRGNDGSSLQTLTYEESLVFTASLARDLFAHAFNVSTNVESWGKGEVLCFLSIIQFIITTAPKGAGVGRRKLREAAVNHFSQVTHENNLPIVDTEAHQELLLLLRQVLLNYVTIARVPAGSRLFVQYSYKFDRKSLYNQLKGSKRQDSVARVRKSAPSPPTGLQIAAHRARKCSSYHLTVCAPAGSYIERAILHDGSGKRTPKVRVSDYVLNTPYFRIAGLGSSEVHFYARQFQATQAPLFLNLKIFEKPPGALGRAALASFLVWALILVAAAGASDPSDSGFQIDLAAMITAAISAAIGTWVFVSGVGSSRDDFKSLTSIGCALSTIVSSLAALVLLVLGRISVWQPDRSAAFNLIFVSDWRWSILGMVGLGTTCIALSALVLRSLHYRWILSQRRWHLDIQDSVDHN